MNRLSRSLTALAGGLLSLLAGLACATFYLLFTETGARWLAEQARTQLAGLEWTTLHGTLADGLRIEGLAWSGPEFGLQVDTLRVSGRANCLWRLTLCLSGLDAAGVRGWTSTADRAPRPPSALLPFPLETGPVRVTNLEWRDGAEAQAAFLQLELVRFQARMHGRSLHIDELLVTQDRRQLQADAEIRLAHPWPLQLSARLETDIPQRLQGLLGTARAGIDARLQGSLAILRGELSVDSGSHAGFTFEAGLLAPAPDLNGKLKIPKLELGSSQAGVSLRDIELGLDGSIAKLKVQTSARVTRLNVRGADGLPAGTLRGQALLGRNGARGITLQYDSMDAASTLRWQGQLTWPDQIRGDGRLQFRTEALASWAPGLEGAARLEGSLGGQGDRDEMQIRLDINRFAGSMLDTPVELAGVLALQARGETLRIDLDALSGHIDGAEIRAQGKLVPALEIAGRFRLDDLQSLHAESSGSAAGDFRLSGPAAMPRLQFTAQAANPRYRSARAAAATLSGSITLQDVPQFALQGRLDALDGLPPVVPLTAAQLQLTGTPADFRLELSAAGPESGAGLHINARRAGVRQETRLVLSAAHLYAPSLLRWNLDAPAMLSWNADRKSLQIDDALCLGGAGGRFCLLAGSSLPASGDETLLRIDRLHPSAWPSLLPPGLEIAGSFGGDARVAWGTAAPVLGLQLEGGPGELLLRPVDGREPVRHPYSSFQLAGDADATGTRTQLQISSASIGEIEAGLSLGRDNAELIGKVRIEGLQLAPLRPLLPALETLSGQVDAAFDLSGRRDRPQATGSLRLSGGQFGGTTLPLQVNELQIAATFAGDHLAFEGSFDTREAEEIAAGGQTFAGRATISGTAHWEDRDWRVETVVSGERLLLQVGGHTRLELDGRVETRLSPESLRADGSALVRSGRIRLPRYSGEGVALADDVILVPTPAAPASRAELPFSTVATSLELDFGEQLEFSGFGVDGWLGGKLSLVDLHREHPRGQGRIQVSNGRYRAYGQRLKLRRCRLEFRGNLQEPWIDAEAVRPLDDLVAGVRVSGPASEPLVTLFSEPPLPEEEILSWLVLGKPLGTGTAQDSQALSAALLSYGLRNSEGAGERIADRLGISQFEVGTGGDGNGSGVYASGYLSPRLFVRYGIAGVEAINSLTLRYRLLPSLFLEASSGLESAVDVLYSFSF